MTVIEERFAETSPVLVWTQEQFIDAWEAGVFVGHKRVQMIEGEVWELGPMHLWHGAATSTVNALLRQPGVKVYSAATLPTSNSVPDPDVWVLREGAKPTGDVRGYETWQPEDVLLVVEVADSTLSADLTKKAEAYARGGIQHYWVVARDALHVFTKPSRHGYEQHDVLTADDEVSLPYATKKVLGVAEMISG